MRYCELVGRSKGPKVSATGARPYRGDVVVGSRSVRDNPTNEPVKTKTRLGRVLNTFPSSLSSAPAFEESSWTSSRMTRQSLVSVPRRFKRFHAVLRGGRGAVTASPAGPAENPSTLLAARTKRVRREADSLIPL